MHKIPYYPEPSSSILFILSVGGLGITCIVETLMKDYDPIRIYIGIFFLCSTIPSFIFLFNKKYLLLSDQEIIVPNYYPFMKDKKITIGSISSSSEIKHQKFNVIVLHTTKKIWIHSFFMTTENYDFAKDWIKTKTRFI